MGKMYKALEKAERERFEESMGDVAKEKIYDKGDEVFNSNLLNESLIASIQPGSLAAEQFRKLRINLRNIKLPEPPKTILVTSAKEAEGKTTVSANLAVTISQELNSHALLVEADIRNPVLKEWFGCKSSKGLTDYLCNDTDISSIIEKTALEKLNIICCGDIKNNPVELIGSKKMECLLHELKSRYPDRYIIIDSSPLLTTSEPNVLMKLVDSVLLVIRAGYTPREEIMEALSHLKRESIIGIVLNHLQFHIPAMHSKYFGSSSYYRRYGADCRQLNRSKGIIRFFGR
jgi:exopolysaccharide/PEP-CTERM locus tyrosine autokinase